MFWSVSIILHNVHVIMALCLHTQHTPQKINYVHIPTHKCFTDARVFTIKSFSFWIFTMWYYLKGVTLTKQKQTIEGRKEQDHSYEKWWKQCFIAEWKTNRPWLKIETNPNGKKIMFCDFCIKAGISSDKTSFINGCTNFKLETIKTPWIWQYASLFCE